MALRSGRGGFTFIEAMTAVAITAMAGGAVLLGVNSSLLATKTALEQTIAQGLAQQLMDELAGMAYARNAASPYEYPLAPTSAELAGPGRTQFTNLADYNGLTEAPPVDPYGIPLGTDDGQGSTRNPSLQNTYLSNWQRTALVYYVDPTTQSTELAPGQTSNFRAAEVHVWVQDKSGTLRQVYMLRRVFAYVPSS